jgi:hypothetical protein
MTQILDHGSVELIEEWQLQLRDLYARAEHVYQQGLMRGVPKEVARRAVTVGLLQPDARIGEPA